MFSPSLPYIIYQNLKRKPYRTLAVAMFVLVSTASLFAATLLLRGVQNSLQIGITRLGADLVVVPEGERVAAQEAFIVGQPSMFYMDASVEQEVAALPGVERTSSQVFVQTLSNASCCVGDFFLVSFDPRTDFTIRPWLTGLLDRELKSEEVLVGDRILLQEGEGVLFYGSMFRVAGTLEATGMGIDRTVFVPVDGLRQMIAASPEKAEKPLTIAPDQISTVLVKVKPGTDPMDIAEQIENSIPDVQAITATNLILSVSEQLSNLLAVLLTAIVALWLTSLLAIGLVFTLVSNERQREMGLLRAMGARPGHVFRLLMGEAVLLTGLGGAAGIIVSGVLLAAFGPLLEHSLKIPFLLPALPELVGLVGLMIALAVCSGAAACFLPAFRISRMEPYEAIRSGE